MTDVKVRVARGAALLDEKRPDWFMSVNPHVLDMSACDACVLGQLYGDYTVGVDTTLPGEYWSAEACPAAFGFDQSEVYPREEWSDLRTEWVSVINDRRARRYLKGESK